MVLLDADKLSATPITLRSPYLLLAGKPQLVDEPVDLDCALEGVFGRLAVRPLPKALGMSPQAGQPMRPAKPQATREREFIA